MEEAIVENVGEPTPPAASPSSNNEASTEATSDSVPKKKAGRPAGSKDKAPRRKKIVEEPIVKEPPKPEPAQPPPKAEPQAKAQPKAEPQPEAKPADPTPEPMSPSTLIRESARHMLELKRLNDSARKAHLQSVYTRRLQVF